MVLVDSPQIGKTKLLRKLPIGLHAYIWPFLILWPVFFSLYLNEEFYDKYIESSEWTFVWIGTFTTIQTLLWLTTKWNVDFQAWFTCVKAPNVSSAELIKIVPVANAGVAEICPIQNRTVDRSTSYWFNFQKRKFIYNETKKCFAPLHFLIDDSPSPSIKTFKLSRGLNSETQIKKLRDLYGRNSFDIPVPTFIELFKEHAVAPFFVFQVFCVGLWMLDDYWYYSLFTLVMLVAFESTVVWQRQRTLEEFRGMNIKPYTINVFRNNKWGELKTDDLLPGDLASINRSMEDSGVPCDLILIEGTAVVNEAMLSGEATPVLKDSIQLRPNDEPIAVKGLDKNSLLFGGTKVLQVSHDRTNEDESANPIASGVPSPPDGGVMAVVLKTGFETGQGCLVRTMIFSTERVSANTLEALLFILFLLMFALAASWYVWKEGVAKDRKRSKLLLDCVLIITSVVPPELPMELSLAVNTSLAALSKFAIFCTEPFRIPFAGRIDVACFDKTGTLTGENLLVEGIAGLSLNNSNEDKANISGKDHTQLVPAYEAGPETILTLATAHALMKLNDGEIVGEPLEKVTLNSLGWQLDKKDLVSSKVNTAIYKPGYEYHADAAQIRRRFQFSSALKRQSTVSTVIRTNRHSGKKTKSTFVAVKGAPETVKEMLIKVPSKYEETYTHFTRNGGRVLALGYRYLVEDGELGQNAINKLNRNEVESQLNFGGFLILQTPLKDDAREAVQMLSESSHRCVMITGDNPLTAVHVARKVGIVDRECLILDARDDDNEDIKEKKEEAYWQSIDKSVKIHCDPEKLIDGKIYDNYDLCITGNALKRFTKKEVLNQIYRYTWVYARVSPTQKEEILVGLKNLGYTTLMCGDGTNDVGALKQAHIGVALLNGSKEDLEKISEHLRISKLKEVYAKQCQIMKRFNQPIPPVPIQIAHLYPPGPDNPNRDKAIEREDLKKKVRSERLLCDSGSVSSTVKSDSEGNTREKIVTAPGTEVAENGTQVKAKEEVNSKGQPSLASMIGDFQKKLLEQEIDENEPPNIKLGDASCAAPFTSKLSNVVAITNIVRQGRCTLVATMQMYKILALNCLINAYSLSVLYLSGIKFGDGQVTISGMLMSLCFLSISRAKPVNKLSKARPLNNIFNLYIIGSVLVQFAIHVGALVWLTECVRMITDNEMSSDNLTLKSNGEQSAAIDLEKEFEPSLLNSSVYLLQLIQQVSTFAVNYQGPPFRESIRENRGMYWGLIGVGGIAVACATEFIPELNSALRLVPFSGKFKITLCGIMLLDYSLCYVVERTFRVLFSDYRAKDIALRRPDQLTQESFS